MSTNQKETLSKRATLGAVTLGIKRVIIQAIYTISNIFLARLLFPQDFGTFAIVIFAVTFFTVFSDLGLGPSLVQKKEKLGKKDLQTVFTVHFILVSAIVFLIFLTAPAISGFYNLGKTGVDLFRLYSLYLLFLPFKTASGAVLERKLQYSKLVIIEVLQLAISSGVTVAFAFLGFGVFSFGIGAVFGHMTGAALYFGFSPWPFKLLISKENLFALAKFGLPFQSQALLGLFYGPAILLYLGKIVGSQNLGFYQFAAGLSVIPGAVSEIVNRIIFPLGARTQQDLRFFKKIVERSIEIVSLTSLPIFFLVVTTAPAIIHFIYTDRWLPAVPALYLGLAQMAIIGYTGIFAQLLLSLGKATVMRNIGVVWAILTWILSPPLIYLFNFVGMSLAGLLVSASGLWLIFRLRKEINFSFLPNFTPFFAASAISGLATFAFLNLLPHTFKSLIFALIFGGLIYLGLVLLLARKMLVENSKLLISVFVKLNP